MTMPTYRNLPDGETATACGDAPLPGIANGEPGTGVSAPVFGLILNAETLALVDSELATYANCSLGETATLYGPIPTANGDPGTGVSIPVLALMLKAETLLDPTFAA
jgi:hypothetical protein